MKTDLYCTFMCKNALTFVKSKTNLERKYYVHITCIIYCISKFVSNQKIIFILNLVFTVFVIFPQWPFCLYAHSFTSVFCCVWQKTSHVALVLSNSRSEELWELVCESTKWLFLLYFIVLYLIIRWIASFWNRAIWSAETLHMAGPFEPVVPG